MLHLKNFKVYKPKRIPKELKTLSVMFFISEEGEDFYQACKEARKDTIKLLYNEVGIVSYSEDASQLYPAGCSLVEIPKEDFDESLDILSDGYFFDGNLMKIAVNTKIVLSKKKTDLLSIASAKILPLEDLVAVDIEKEANEAKIRAWKLFRVKVREADSLEDLPPLPEFDD